MYTADTIFAIIMALLCVALVVYYGYVFYDALSGSDDFSAVISRNIVVNTVISGRTQLRVLAIGLVLYAGIYAVGLAYTAALGVAGLLLSLLMTNISMYLRATRLREFT